MTLGERLLTARLEAGLSQRQVAGDTITRNMLSALEHGTAQPSVATLQYLAGVLDKPVGYFLDDGTSGVQKARELYEKAAYRQALDACAAQDGWEAALLTALSAMELARGELAAGRLPYAAELLHRAAEAGAKTPYFTPALERERQLLLIRAEPDAGHTLPPDDRALLYRAEQALNAGEAARCGQLLDCAEDVEAPQWQFLRGRAYLAQRQWAQAAACLQKAEGAFPAAIPLLEQCYRELGDYRMAYEYACKGRR